MNYQSARGDVVPDFVGFAEIAVVVLALKLALRDRDTIVPVAGVLPVVQP